MWLLLSLITAVCIIETYILGGGDIAPKTLAGHRWSQEGEEIGARL